MKKPIKSVACVSPAFVSFQSAASLALADDKPLLEEVLVTAAFDSEQVDSYEWGIKSELLDGALRPNAAVNEPRKWGVQGTYRF